jgi:hypothetical protein
MDRPIVILLLNLLIFGVIVALVLRTMLKTSRKLKKTQGLFGRLEGRSGDVLYAAERCVGLRKDYSDEVLETMRSNEVLNRLYKQGVLMPFLRAVLRATSVAVISGTANEGEGAAPSSDDIMLEPVRSVVIFYDRNESLKLGTLSHTSEAEELGQALADILMVPFVSR